MRESEERFRGAFDYSPIGIGIVGLDGRFVRVNRALCRIGGYGEHELLAMTFADVVPADELDFHTAQVRRLVRGEIESYEREVRYRHKDGHLVWVRFAVSAIRDAAGKVVHLLGQAEDISARRAAEDRLRQAERLEAVGRLAGGVAHEFNNLLAVIGGYAKHALEKAGSGPVRRDLAAIADAAERAAEISRRLLTFSRDDGVHATVLDPNDAVRAVEPLLRRQIRDDVELSVLLAEGIGFVNADRAQLEHAILNLVVNADDAIVGGGRVEIATSRVEVTEASELGLGMPAGSYVALAVSDTGVGIAREARERLFDPFFTTKEQGRGTGLGLAAVYGIVERFGGSVVVESEPGEGATFTIYIPTVAGPPPAASVPSPRGEAGPPPGGSERILVAEDEPALRSLIELILGEAGYRTITAPDGEAALAHAMHAEPPVDLVITDTVMPRLGGPELVQRLRAIRPDARAVYMSGFSDHGFGDELFLQKPFEPDALLRVVRAALDAPPRR